MSLLSNHQHHHTHCWLRLSVLSNHQHHHTHCWLRLSVLRITPLNHLHSKWNVIATNCDKLFLKNLSSELDTGKQYLNPSAHNPDLTTLKNKLLGNIVWKEYSACHQNFPLFTKCFPPFSEKKFQLFSHIYLKVTLPDRRVRTEENSYCKDDCCVLNEGKLLGCPTVVYSMKENFLGALLPCPDWWNIVLLARLTFMLFRFLHSVHDAVVSTLKKRDLTYTVLMGWTKTQTGMWTGLA